MHHYSYVFFEYSIHIYPPKLIWNLTKIWRFEIPGSSRYVKFPAFWILEFFFLVKRHTFLHTKGRSRYEWFLTFRGVFFLLAFWDVEARLKLQRVHVVGDVLELILMIQLSKEHSNWLVEHTCLTQKKLYTCSWFGNSFIFVYWGTLGMFQGSVGIFLEARSTMAIARKSRLELWKVQFPASLWLVYQKA